jgi:Lsr2
MSRDIHWELREADRQRFNLGAAEYEIDLSTANVSRFREQLAPFIRSRR